MNALPTEMTKFSEHSSSAIVKVIVGQGMNQRVHNLHKSLLTEKSEFFRGCLAGHFVEANTNQVLLPNDDPQAFECFVNWAYGGTVAADMTVDECIQAYILAHKLSYDSTPQLQELIIQTLNGAANKEAITLKQVQKVVNSDLAESDLMDAVIVGLANAADKNWEVMSKDETWHGILSADAGLTLRVLAALRTSWSVKTKDALVSSGKRTGGAQAKKRTREQMLATGFGNHPRV
ncbi:uncharacterized protein HMPREF1541_01730 [Cyphellophora europaea CBS 101466]|uniref:BTB domain-containing protein n=1 Tax=Cyphellophora europaea (strain CBS 101466) TaxID=1220924 RepID=W2S3G2_CYPE1|nr:uncharacterized protein HMPREF1541_01730 [Cyphellophora europaea CBS 101466]ETN42573.1 hypothetical protein HMPREF1541_01730 [Cyphellophora europaea CBS 101466]